MFWGAKFLKEKVMGITTYFQVPVFSLMKLDNRDSQILSYVLFLWLHTFLLILLKAEMREREAKTILVSNAIIFNQSTKI